MRSHRYWRATAPPGGFGLALLVQSRRFGWQLQQLVNCKSLTTFCWREVTYSQPSHGFLKKRELKSRGVSRPRKTKQKRGSLHSSQKNVQSKSVSRISSTR